MKSRVIDIILLIIAATVAIVSFFISISVNDSQWFERSGSLTVLFAAVVEYRQLSRGESIKRTTPIGEMRINQTLPGTREKGDEIISAIGLFMVCLGTVIWGYGSPIYEFIC